MDFENKVAHTGIFYTRYIASWVNACRREKQFVRFRGQFQDWLRKECQLSEDEIKEIMWIAENGKLELEESASRRLRSLVE